MGTHAQKLKQRLDKTFSEGIQLEVVLELHLNDTIWSIIEFGDEYRDYSILIVLGMHKLLSLGHTLVMDTLSCE